MPTAPKNEILENHTKHFSLIGWREIPEAFLNLFQLLFTSSLSTTYNFEKKRTVNGDVILVTYKSFDRRRFIAVRRHAKSHIMGCRKRHVAQKEALYGVEFVSLT